MPCSEPVFDIWNRKLHFYVGLYLLFFVWLFSVSGLIINHGTWPMAKFWESRRQEHFQKPLRPVAGSTDLDRARDVLSQLGLTGEIDWNGPALQDGKLVFRANRPGRLLEIRADLAGGSADIAQITVNGWGALHMMHTFSGVRAEDPKMTRDWIVTRIWVFSMDAVAAGLAFMVLSGCWVWFRSGRRRLAGALSLAAGLAVCDWLLAA